MKMDLRSKNRGAIYAEQAYAQGKMLDNSSWSEVLPRNITPSDVDLCFDNGGCILACELSRRESRWEGLNQGQRMLYEALVHRGKVLAILLKHSVPSNKAIDTMLDIESFSVMTTDSLITTLFTPTYSGDRWKPFVLEWYRNPSAVHAQCFHDGIAKPEIS